mgnify:CR=1 FL=1
MKIVVCVKQVPDTKGGVQFNPDGTLNRAAMLAIMNPDDKAGLEAALRLKDQYGAEVTVLTMGLPKAADVLREALAMGADKAILVTDRVLGGADTWATSTTIAGAWYIVRVKTKGTKLMYTLCLFSMIVPFQMVMFTLSKFANMLHLSNPLGIIIVYLGFGAGLAVFMFTGFVKSISLEIEEAAMIDGCTPLQMYFRVVFPILRPTAVTVAILEAMWVWNDYLLPSLVLNINQYKTIPIAIQYLKQSHGMIDWGAMMAMLVLAILPIVIFYIVCQKYIIEGVLAGAVKG